MSGIYHASSIAMLLAADIDELQNEETFRTISESLEELFGSRVIAPYKLEIKCLSHFITLFLPLLTGNQTLGQSYANITMMENITHAYKRYLRRPDFYSKLIMAATSSFLGYCKANASHVVTIASQEFQALAGFHPSQAFNELQKLSNSKLLSALGITATNTIGSTPVDFYTTAARLLEDIHKLFFFSNGFYLFYIYRWLTIRQVSTTPPLQQKRLRLISWIITLRLSIEFSAFVARFCWNYCKLLSRLADLDAADTSAQEERPSDSELSRPDSCRASQQCPLCMDAIQEAGLTPCGHVFCWSCIMSHVSSARGGASCPLCRSSVKPTQVRALYGYC